MNVINRRKDRSSISVSTYTTVESYYRLDPKKVNPTTTNQCCSFSLGGLHIAKEDILL